MGRILGVDYGEKRVGLALSDPFKIIASPFKTIVVNSKEQLFEELRIIISENEIEKIILGYPMGLNGEKTNKTKDVEKFKEELENIFDKIEFYDESFSSVKAQKIMKTMGKKQKNNKEYIDMLAAQVILEDYLKSRF